MSKRCLIEHWQRFRGGPDFSRVEKLITQLEKYQFNITLPQSNVSTTEPPREVNFPFNQNGWFERNAKQEQQHKWVHIYTEIWMYLPVGLLSRMHELGKLSFSAWIKKIPDAKSINAKNVNELGVFLLNEYDEYFNSPVVDNGSLKGINTKIRNEKLERLKEHSKELIQEQTQYALEQRGFPELAPYKIKSINGNDWVYYVEHFPRTSSHSRYYSFPLNEQYYLIIRFWYRVDSGQKFKLWKKHAEAAEKRIMESVKIESVENLQIESQK